MQARLVQPAGERPGRRGRTPIAFTVNSAAGFVIGIDIGSTTLRVAATDIYGAVLREDELEAATGGARAVDEQITAVVRDVVRRLGASHGELLAMGVSTPGVVDPATRRVTSLAWNVSSTGQLDALATLESRFGVPVLVDNDVNMAAVGEKWHGLGRGVSTFVFIWIGAGVGMGIVLDDDLFRGFHGAAGEIAYLPLASDPFDAHHRRIGALEDEIGAAGVLDAYNRAAAGGTRPAHPAADVEAAASGRRTQATGPGAPAESAREVFERAAGGDAAAVEVVENVARRLGLAIATVCAVIDPELVILGGRIGGAVDLLPAVRATVGRLLPLPVRIETSVLAQRASLEGALAMGLHEARERLFSQERRARA